LTPSKVASFKDCALAFRLSVIDGLPEPVSRDAVKGTLVHRALELLMWEEDPGGRSPEAALSKLAVAAAEMVDDPEYQQLLLSAEEHEALVADGESLVRNYFLLENPDAVRVIGTEVRLSASLGNLHLRGIIDRLELDAEGQLVVTDYKTGRAPSQHYEQFRLGGVHFYAFLCEQVLGRRPAKIQLLHLREPLAISTVPDDLSVRGLQQQAIAIWAAVEQACDREDFRPRPGHLCASCGYHAYCPALGGDLSLVPGGVAASPLAG
jgi:putative RecB family exonuclease